MIHDNNLKQKCEYRNNNHQLQMMLESHTQLSSIFSQNANNYLAFKGEKDKTRTCKAK